MSRIHLSAPDVGELEERYAVDAIRSGWVAPLGPHVDAFEAEMCERVGARHAVALSSGTAAIHLALLAWGVGPGDTVVAPTMTFAATINAIIYTGAAVCLVDCDPVSGNLDVDLLESTLIELHRRGARVPAVIAVDLLGKCCEYTRLEALAERYSCKVLADSAESLGASHDGRQAGSLGDGTVLSFNGNKILTTSGGGMFLTDDVEIAERVRYLSTQARQPVVHYEHKDVGYNYRLSNVLAAVGRAQLLRLDEMIQRRRKLRERYARLFDGQDGVVVFGRDGDLKDNCWLTAVLVDPQQARGSAESLRTNLQSADIEARPLWKPMHMQPVFLELEANITGCAEQLFHRGLTLPSGSGMSEPDFDRVINVILNWLTDEKQP